MNTECVALELERNALRSTLRAVLARAVAVERERDQLAAALGEVEQQVRLALIAGNPLAYSIRGALARTSATPPPQ